LVPLADAKDLPPTRYVPAPFVAMGLSHRSWTQISTSEILGILFDTRRARFITLQRSRKSRECRAGPNRSCLSESTTGPRALHPEFRRPGKLHWFSRCRLKTLPPRAFGRSLSEHARGSAQKLRTSGASLRRRLRRAAAAGAPWAANGVTSGHGAGDRSEVCGAVACGSSPPAFASLSYLRSQPVDVGCPK
jgi:hypothetical protein